MTREQAMAITRRYEGCRLESYRDTLGNRTIGVGHLQAAGDHRKVITQERADAMFLSDYTAHAAEGMKLLGVPALRYDLSHKEGRDAYHEAVARCMQRENEAANQWATGEIDSRHAAWFDLRFNLGPRLQHFRRVRVAWEKGDFITAGDELLFVHSASEPRVKTRYATQTGRRATDNAYRIRTNSEPVEVER